MSSCGPWPTPTFASTAPESGLTITNVASSLLRTSSRPPPDCAAAATMVNAAAAAVRQNAIFIAPLSIIHNGGKAGRQKGRKAGIQGRKAGIQGRKAGRRKRRRRESWKDGRQRPFQPSNHRPPSFHPSVLRHSTPPAFHP